MCLLQVRMNKYSSHEAVLFVREGCTADPG